MTPTKLIVFRLFLVTFGRIPWVSKVLKKLLVRRVITDVKGQSPYVAHSRFFSVNDLKVRPLAPAPSMSGTEVQPPPH